MKEKKNIFVSRWGFILACVGSAVGMANVWGFPYKLGVNGGFAFLLAYLICVALFSYVGLASEYAIGRRARTGTLGAYKLAWSSVGNGRLGKIIGWIPLIGTAGVAIGYAVIIAYVLKALLQSLSASLMTVDTTSWFNSFALQPYSVVLLHFVVIAVTLLTLAFGARSIEKTNKIMMPLFFGLFVILAIRVALLPGAFDGYRFLFEPNWAKLADPMIWVSAMGQAFFSLSIAGSGMIVYGAYLPDSEDIVSGAKNTALFDTLAALVAALVMIPACFAYNLDPAAGPGLLFVTLPKILQNMPLGRVFAIILFTAVIFGGISSLQNMLEVVAESFLYRFPRLKRLPLLLALLIVYFGIGVNIEAIYVLGPWMDVVSIYIIPISATSSAISIFWAFKKEDLLEEINKGAKRPYGRFWYTVGKYVYVPAAILLCVIAIKLGISF